MFDAVLHPKHARLSNIIIVLSNIIKHHPKHARLSNVIIVLSNIIMATRR